MTRTGRFRRCGLGHSKRDRLVGTAGQRDESSMEGASDVFEKHLHGRDVGCVVFFGPCQDVTADAAGGFFEYPCSRVARDWKRNLLAFRV